MSDIRNRQNSTLNSSIGRCIRRRSGGSTRTHRKRSTLSAGCRISFGIRRRGQAVPEPGQARSRDGGIGRDGCGSRPVSRVLSGAAIHLRHTSPCACSDLPGSGAGHASSPIGNTLPYLVLLRVGFTVPSVSPPTRCALTAPFHPYPVALRRCAGSRRSVFCGTFRGLAPPRRYLAPCPSEPGLSSASRSDAATARSTPALHSVTPTAPDSSVRARRPARGGPAAVPTSPGRTTAVWTARLVGQPTGHGVDVCHGAQARVADLGESATGPQ